MIAPVSKEQKTLAGVACAVAAALCWSLAGIIVRSLDLPAIDVSFWRSTFMSAALLPLVIWRRSAALLDLRENPATVIGSGVLMGVTFVTYIVALGLTSVANVAFVLATYPLFTALIAWLWIGERIARRTMIAMLAALCGLGLTFSDALKPTDLAGLAVAMILPLAFSGNAVALRRRRLREPMVGLLLAAILSALLALPFVDIGRLEGRHLPLLLVLGPVQLALGLYLFTRSLRHLPAAQAALIANLEMVLGPLWVWLAYGERPGTLALIGGALVLAAVLADGLGHLRPSR